MFELMIRAKKVEIDSDMDVTLTVDEDRADGILEDIYKKCCPNALLESAREDLDDDEIFFELDGVSPDEMMKRLTKEEVVEFFGITEEAESDIS